MYIGYEMQRKRILVASLCGFVAGIFCYISGVILIPIGHDLLLFIWVVVNRTLLGFVIGISILKFHWAINGLIVGLTVGLVFPLNAIMVGKELPLVISVYIMGIIYGILVEFFTSVVFKYRAA
jgi:hypothetical protein